MNDNALLTCSRGPVFGSSPAELDDYLEIGFDAAVERILGPGGVEESELDPPGFDPDAPLDTRTVQLCWLYRMAHTRKVRSATSLPK